jgi:hypothetical protein
MRVAIICAFFTPVAAALMTVNFTTFVALSALVGSVGHVVRRLLRADPREGNGRPKDNDKAYDRHQC